jgi:hypothetical protein
MMTARTMRRPRASRADCPLQRNVLPGELPQESWLFGRSCTLLAKALPAIFDGHPRRIASSR